MDINSVVGRLVGIKPLIEGILKITGAVGYPTMSFTMAKLSGMSRGSDFEQRFRLAARSAIE